MKHARWTFARLLLPLAAAGALAGCVIAPDPPGSVAYVGAPVVVAVPPVAIGVGVGSYYRPGPYYGGWSHRGWGWR